ncbi:uncharacterized protein LOC127854268 [Dreissena polymorpha]|uniref:C1q domain-containing protein n=1 Tax=Dreissena polymorpha TaxID=45954 RepID=A0A9D4CRI4_DREPO|nr:uncharacterized protein LOC127854268 [Dreissena polymorpha]KAH3730320.1 hypothetical protein DPMN_056303 [Dreissena polymorpha]
MERCSLVFFMYTLCTVFASEPSCQVCSRYDYEEKILERVIRNELVLQNTLQSIRETNENVIAGLQALQEEKVKINAVLKIIERKQTYIETYSASTLTNVSKAFLEIQERSNRIDNDTIDELKTPLVHFHARTAALITVNKDLTVPFPVVDVNQGVGYDSSTAIFTASVAGLYIFVVQYCTHGSKWATLVIVHNGKPLQSAGHYAADGLGHCSTMQAFASVTIGDKVWVRASAASDLFSEPERSTSFSGILVHN